MKWLNAAADEIVECMKSSIKLTLEAKEKKSARLRITIMKTSNTHYSLP